MLKILNRILTNQMDPNIVMAKLDEIQKGINEIKKAAADRHITPSQAIQIERSIARDKGTKIGIFLPSNREAYEYGQEFVGILKRAGWDVKEYPGFMASVPVIGIAVYCHDGPRPFGTDALFFALRDAQVVDLQPAVIITKAVPQELMLVVGQKP